MDLHRKANRLSRTSGAEKPFNSFVLCSEERICLRFVYTLKEKSVLSLHNNVIASNSLNSYVVHFFSRLLLTFSFFFNFSESSVTTQRNQTHVGSFREVFSDLFSCKNRIVCDFCSA